MSEGKNSTVDKALLSVKYSALAFACGQAPLLWILLESQWEWTSLLWRLATAYLLILIVGKSLFPPFYSVWWRAATTGLGVCSGLLLFFCRCDQWAFGLYLGLLFTFHFLEFAVTGLTNPFNLSTDSFLLNHSLQYWLAAMASWTEYFIELYFFPHLKVRPEVVVLGLAVCVLGEILRKAAMFHAGNSFSHIVQSSKKNDHVLVTSGVFSLVRHPSYLGWFLWSLGTQIVLSNPICLIIYGFVSWTFFNERIYIEEHSLLNFFGQDYQLYQKRVPTGIPGILGFIPPFTISTSEN